jgi:hypothetical protein
MDVTPVSSVFVDMSGSPEDFGHLLPFASLSHDFDAASALSLAFRSP